MLPINLSDKLLHAAGILEKLIDTKNEISKLSVEMGANVTEGKINSIRGLLRGIYFDGMDVAAIQADLSSKATPFLPDYHVLQQTLQIIFSNADLDTMINYIQAVEVTEDWTPSPEALASHYGRLQQRYHYFEARNQAEAFSLLFKELVSACRKISVLIEKNNTPDDTMAYDYAYKLMAMLVDENKTIPSLQDMSKKIDSLLTPNDKKPEPNAKPFHDTLLDLQLPNTQNKAAWIALIHQEGFKILPFYTVAVQLEEKNNNRMPLTMAQAKAAAALCGYTRAADDMAFARLCHSYNAPEATFNAGLDFIGKPPVWPKKTMDSLPDVTIETADSAYAWTKLPVNDKRGLILGKITNCCQSIDGHSRQCVVDAANLASNGVYVLLKRKKSNASSCKKPDGSINDEDFQIIGQSYAWVSKTGNLCLDSIECLNNSITPEQLRDTLTSFAQEVIKTEPTIKRVTLGDGGKTPQGLFPTKTPLPEAMRQGFFYGNAKSQYLIAQQPSRLKEEQFSELRSRYQAPFLDCLLYFAQYVNDTQGLAERIATLLTNNPSLTKTFSSQNLFTLLHFKQTPALDDLESVDWSNALPLGLSTGQLMWQANTLDQKMSALAYIPIQDRLPVAKEKGRDGRVVLHFAAKNPELFKTVLELYPESDRLAAVKETDQSGWSVLNYACGNLESVKTVLTLLPESDRLEAVKEKDRYGRNVVYYATQNPELFKMVLELYPESDRLTAVKEKDEYDKSVFDMAAHNPESLRMVLTLFPESDRLVALKEKNKHGRSILYSAVVNPESFAMVFSLLPESDRLAAVIEKDWALESVLFLALKSPESLNTMLALLTESEHLAALKEKNHDGESVLHYTAEINPELFKTMLALLTESDRLTALKEKNYAGKSVLHIAASNPESFAMVFSLLPESDRLAAVIEKDRAGESVFKIALKSPKSLNTMLALLTESERLAALKEKNHDGESVLHYTAEINPELFKTMLALLTESDRLTALKEKNYAGKSVLHIAASNPESFKMVLELFPESERLAAVIEKDRAGESVFNIAARNAESFETALVSPSIEQLRSLHQEDKTLGRNNHVELIKRVIAEKNLKLGLSDTLKDDRVTHRVENSRPLSAKLFSPSQAALNEEPEANRLNVIPDPFIRL